MKVIQAIDRRLVKENSSWELWLNMLITNSWVLWVDHRDTRSIALCCDSMQELLWPERLARHEVLIHAGNLVKVTIPSIGVLPMYLFFIIHYRVLHTLALCIRYLARRLFIRELLMFGVMNNIRAILSLWMRCMLWIMILIYYLCVYFHNLF